MDTLGKFLFQIMLATLSTLLFAWAGMTVWGWFMVPVGVQMLPFSIFLGTSFLISMISVWTHRITKEDLEKKDDGRFARGVVITLLKVVTIFIVLGVAGVVHTLMF